MSTKNSGHIEIDMLHEPLLMKILLFALPLAASSVLQQLFNSVDVARVWFHQNEDGSVASRLGLHLRDSWISPAWHGPFDASDPSDCFRDLHPAYCLDLHSLPGLARIPCADVRLPRLVDHHRCHGHDSLARHVPQSSQEITNNLRVNRRSRHKF